MTQKWGNKQACFLQVNPPYYMKNTSTKHAHKKMHAKIHEKISAKLIFGN